MHSTYCILQMMPEKGLETRRAWKAWKGSSKAILLVFPPHPKVSHSLSSFLMFRPWNKKKSMFMMIEETAWYFSTTPATLMKGYRDWELATLWIITFFAAYNTQFAKQDKMISYFPNSQIRWPSIEELVASLLVMLRKNLGFPLEYWQMAFYQTNFTQFVVLILVRTKHQKMPCIWQRQRWWLSNSYTDDLFTAGNRLRFRLTI